MRNAGTSTLESAWRRQQQWSMAADRCKRSLQGWRLTVLMLAIVSSVAGTWSGAVPPGTTARIILCMFAALTAAVAPVLARFFVGPDRISQWVRARSASEAFKSEAFRFRTRTGDYAGADATERRTAAIQRISKSVESIPVPTLEEIVVDEEKLAPLSIEAYLEQRVLNQIDTYYRPKAEHHAHRASIYRNLHFWLMLLGAILLALSTFADVGLGPWIAVITTITSSVLAHAAAGRHDELVLTFRATANRLEEITNNWRDTPRDREATSAEKADLVSACEDGISTENQSWHAKFASLP